MSSDPVLAVRAGTRRPVINWPGHPTTAAGLLTNLEPVAPFAGEISAAYSELIRQQSPRPRRSKSDTAPTAREQTALRRLAAGGRQPPTRSAVIASLADDLARAAQSIPSLIDTLGALQRPVSGSALRARAVYVPDWDQRVSYADERLTDVGGSGPPPNEHGPNADVTWWPRPSPAGRTLGLQLIEMPPRLTIWWDWGQRPPLADYATTMQLLREGAADWSVVVGVAAAAGVSRARRTQARDRNTAFRNWRDHLAPAADLFAAAWAAWIHQTRQHLAAVLDEDPAGGISTMPALTTTSAVVSSVAATIRDQITQGQGGRFRIGDSEQAFSWSSGLPSTLVTACTNATTGSRHLDVLRAVDSGTPTGPVAAKGTKPDAVTFSTDTLDLLKFAGVARIDTESANWIANIETAVAGVLVSRLLRGIEQSIVAALEADGGLDAVGTDMTAAALDGIAKVAGAGGRAGVIALSSADWVSLMSAGSAGYINLESPATDPTTVTWLGLVPVIVPGLVAGTAYVYDPRSVVVYEADGGPIVIVDLGSQLGTNEIRVAAEVFAGPFVTNPGGVAKLTVTP